MESANLIILDGIPGTGKTTGGETIAHELSERGMPCRFYPELEDNHPLRIYGDPVSFEDECASNCYVTKTLGLWSDFADSRLKSGQITIIESWLFQDTIGWSWRSGLGGDRAINLFRAIRRTIAPLSPVLIHFHMTNVQSHLQQLCMVRGSDWGRSVLGDDSSDGTCRCILAAQEFERQQRFVQPIVDSWEIPKRIITDRYFDWHQDGGFVLSALTMERSQGVAMQDGDSA